MSTGGDGDAANRGLLSLARPPRTDKNGAQSRDLCRRHTASDVNAAMCSVWSYEALRQLHASSSAPYKTKPPSASLEALGPVSAEPSLDGLQSSSRDDTRSMLGSHSRAGVKRGRAVAFTGNAMSTETELPSQLRRMISLSTQIGQGQTDGHTAQACELTSGSWQSLGNLPGGSSSATHCGAAGSSRPAKASLPAARTSASSVIGGVSSASGSHLSALISSSSPAVAEQVRAAPMTIPALSEQRHAVTITAGAPSAKTTSGAPRVTHSFVSPPAHRSLRADRHCTRLVEPDPDRGHQVLSSAAVTPTTGCPADAAATGVEDPTAREVQERSSGSPGVPASGKTPGGAATLTAATCKGLGATSGCEEAGAQLRGRRGVADAARSGEGSSAGGEAPTAARPVVQPLPPDARGENERAAAGKRGLEAWREVGNWVCEQVTEAVTAAAAPELMVLDQRQAPAERVTAQVGVALPPELAARLKKPIRIIQPISKTWEAETLQSGGGGGAVLPTAISGGGLAGAPSSGTAAATSPADAQALSAPKPWLKDWHENSGMRDCAPSVAGAAMHAGAGSLAAVPRAVVDGKTVAAEPGSGVVAEKSVVSRPATDVSSLRAGADGVPGVIGVATEGAREPADKRVLTARTAKTAAAESVRASASVQPAAVACGAPLQPPIRALGALHPEPQPPAGSGSSLTDPYQLAALMPALAALASLPPADNVSPFSGAYPAALASLAQAVSGPTSSTAPSMMPPSFGSSGTIASGTPASVLALARNSSSLPNLSSGALPGWGMPDDFGAGPARPANVVSRAAAARMTDPFAGGAASVTAGLEAVAASRPAMAARLGSSMAAAGPSALLTLQPRPPLQQRTASTATATSASCLGKVQGELTLLYQWYVANKTVYLDQAQRQLQRIEALTAAREGAGADADCGGADAAAVASAKVESAEAVRAYETALKIMSVCGRVEQQWLAPPPKGMGPVGSGDAPIAGATAERRPQTASAPLSKQVPAPVVVLPGGVTRGSADAAAGGSSPGMATAGAGPGLPAQCTDAMDKSGLAPGAAGLALPLNVPAPSSGWSHGAGAALAVAAALVDSVARSGFAAHGTGDGPGPGGPDTCTAAGMTLRETAAARGRMSPAAVAGTGAAPLAAGGPSARPLAGLPLSWVLPGLHAVGGFGPSGTNAAAPPPLRGAAAALPPKVTRLGQPTSA